MLKQEARIMPPTSSDAPCATSGRSPSMKANETTHHHRAEAQTRALWLPARARARPAWAGPWRTRQSEGHSSRPAPIGTTMPIWPDDDSKETSSRSRTRLSNSASSRLIYSGPARQSLDQAHRRLISSPSLPEFPRFLLSTRRDRNPPRGRLTPREL